MCKWNDKIDMGNDQVIMDLPDSLCTYKYNRKVCVDSCISEQIKILWGNNIETRGCCCGHGKSKFGGITLVISEEYDGKDIKRIQEILCDNDNRRWSILQWRQQQGEYVLVNVGRSR